MQTFKIFYYIFPNIFSNIFFFFMMASGLAAAVPAKDAVPAAPSQTFGGCPDIIACYNQCRGAGHLGGMCTGTAPGNCVCEM